MDRTFVSVNLQNLVTVPAMVFLMFLLAAVVWQFILRLVGDQSEAPANGGGY